MMALALALALAAEPALKLDPQITLWLELDTNAKRVPSGLLGDTAGHITPPLGPAELPLADGLVETLATLAAEVHNDKVTLRSETALGIKLFFAERAERMIAAQERAALSTSLGDGAALTLTAFGKGRTQISGVRTYALASGTALLDKTTFDWLTLRAGFSGQAFDALDNDIDLDGVPDGIDVAPKNPCIPNENARACSVPLPLDPCADTAPALACPSIFTSAGASLLAGARAALGSAEHLDVMLDGGAHAYPFAPRDLAPNQPDRRADLVGTATIQLTSARRVFLSAGYAVTRDASNTRGESYTRHRLSGVVGFRLPADVTCSAQGALQLTQYDDGVSIGQAYFFGDDQESQNFVDVTLSRPLFGGLTVEGHIAFFGNELAVEGARFSRETAALGIRAQL